MSFLDINECEPNPIATHNCNTRAACINTIGSFACCGIGYTASANRTGFFSVSFLHVNTNRLINIQTNVVSIPVLSFLFFYSLLTPLCVDEHHNSRMCSYLFPFPFFFLFFESCVMDHEKKFFFFFSPSFFFFFYSFSTLFSL